MLKRLLQLSNKIAKFIYGMIDHKYNATYGRIIAVLSIRYVLSGAIRLILAYEFCYHYQLLQRFLQA